MIAMVATLVAWSSASALGGVSAPSLRALDVSSSPGTPAIIGCDNFTGTTGATLNGRAASSATQCAGRSWTVHNGSWTIQSNSAASDSTVAAHATLNTADASSTVGVTLGAINTGTRSGGLVASHDGTSTFLAAVATNGSPDTVALRLYNAGAPTVLAGVSVALTAANRLTLTRNSGSVTVGLNGSTVLTHTLTAADITTLGSGGRTGLFGGTAAVRFDDLLVDDR